MRTHKQRENSLTKLIKQYLNKMTNEDKFIEKLDKRYPEANILTPTKEKNSIMVINAYIKWYGDFRMWVFDDPSVGLIEEAFVSGTDTFLDILANGRETITLIFSAKYFPDSMLMVELESTEEEGEGGSYYFAPEFNHRLWLCPSLLKYFPKPPINIYLQYK